MCNSLEENSDLNLLWHYTSVENAKNIIKSKQIWLSNVLGSNDSQEIIYGLNLYSNEFEKITQNSVDSGVANDMRMAYKNLISLVRNDWISEDSPVGRYGTIFVGSFSKRGDLLSQWRGYCQNEGFSLGFDRDLLQTSFGQDATLSDCAYGEKDGQSALDQVLSGMKADIARAKASRFQILSRYIKDIRLDKILIRQIARSIATVKHDGFHEECEVRAIALRTINEPDRFSVGSRPGSDFKYVPLNWENSLRHIRLSPMRDQDAAEDDIRSFLSDYGSSLSHVKISRSPIPFRKHSR